MVGIISLNICILGEDLYDTFSVHAGVEVANMLNNCQKKTYLGQLAGTELPGVCRTSFMTRTIKVNNWKSYRPPVKLSGFLHHDRKWSTVQSVL